MSQAFALCRQRAGTAGRLIAVALAALWLGAAAEGASARTITPYELVDSFKAEDSSKGAFTNVDTVAYHQATDRVLVTDGTGAAARLIQFDASGKPVPFSGTGSDTIEFPGGTATASNPFNYVAVDNSGGPSDGRIYIQSSQNATSLYGFNADGTPLGPPWPLCGSPCANWWGAKGLDVGLDGRVWIANGGDTQADNNSQSKFWWVDPSGSISVRSHWAADGFGVLDRIAIRSDGNVLFTTRPVTGAGGKLSELRMADAEGNLLPDRYLGPGANQGGSQGVNAIAVNRSDDSFFLNMRSSVDFYDNEFHLIDSFGAVNQSAGLAVDWDTGTVYLPSRGPGAANQRVDIYEPGDPVVVPTVEVAPPSSDGSSGVMRAVVDPDGGGDTTDCYFMYGTEPLTMTTKATCEQGQSLPSEGGPQEVSFQLNALTKGSRYYYRAFAVNAAGKPQGSQIGTFPVADKPVLNQFGVVNVNTNTTDVSLTISPEGDEAEYWVEYGTTEALGSNTPKAITASKTGTADVEVELTGLTPGTTYYYKVVVANQVGEVESPVRTFRTFEFAPPTQACPNALARQQTGASLLLDCRAYELVSAVDTGGVNVTSDIVEGQTPYGGNPRAAGAAFYSVEGGAIPGTGNPPNRVGDPYLALRGEDGWETSYVGIEADVLPGLEPFSSPMVAASDDGRTIVFGGDDLCDPCFADGSTGIPVRRDGQLIQGMRGSLPAADPVPAGEVREPLSRDGSRLVFGSTQKLEPAGRDGELTIYARDLEADVTEVVSTDSLGKALTGTVAGLGVSDDGERVLVGREVGSDAAGNSLYDLFVHLQGREGSVPVVAAAPGAIPAGLSSDGRQVFFTTEAKLAGDGDGSADLFRATVTPEGATVVKLSGADSDACAPSEEWNGGGCSVLAVSGGGGVSDDGSTAYFLSPQQLDGGAVAGEPNLYVVRGTAAPELVATLDPADPLVVSAREAAAERRSAEFEVAPDGAHAVFTTTRPLTGFENRGHAEVYRHSTQGGDLVCASCAPTNAPARGPARLASDGASLTADGRVFFVSPDALVLRDTNNRDDVYEWSPEGGGTVELISSGIEDNPSSLLTVTADGTDVLFFSRAALTPLGPAGPLVRIYSARAEGGFFFVPPSPPCAAADECRGAGTQPAPEKPVRTVAGDSAPVIECSPHAARARAAAKRARALRARARRAKSRAAKRRLRTRARRAQAQAKRQRAATQRCRQSGGLG